ncbi:esterase/lipase family protein [Kitasatospora sp. HPMI-4]|uniref:esterase/lipase family protein n=1 Tax=Kitasatospora sp. HPMI-4 TaxID=3448443 RepID=UPI003F1C607B
MAGKASVVFAHGLWADGSCFAKLIPTLQGEGREVFVSQHGLDSLEGDVACVTRAINHVPGPVVLVGHSYGGTLITKAGVHDRVGALVYICALAPDDDETSQQHLDAFPSSPVFEHLEVADNRIYLKESVSATSAVICRWRNRSSCWRPLTRRSRTSSTSRFPATPGEPSRAGTSWASRTAR